MSPATPFACRVVRDQRADAIREQVDPAGGHELSGLLEPKGEPTGAAEQVEHTTDGRAAAARRRKTWPRPASDVV